MSPGVFCPLFTGTLEMMASQKLAFPFSRSQCDKSDHFLSSPERAIANTSGSNDKGNIFVLRWTGLIPKLSPFLLHSFLYIHSDVTPRHKSVILGSDREGFTSTSQDHWIRVETDGWTQRKTARGKQKGTETKETGTDRA